MSNNSPINKVLKLQNEKDPYKHSMLNFKLLKLLNPKKKKNEAFGKNFLAIYNLVILSIS